MIAKSASPAAGNAAPAAAPASPDLRGELLRLGAKLATASGESPVKTAHDFAIFVEESGKPELALKALDAAVVEFADRHEHLRGRQPASASRVVIRALEMFAYLVESG